MDYRAIDNKQEFEITTKKLKEEEKQQVSLMKSIMNRLGINIDLKNESK